MRAFVPRAAFWGDGDGIDDSESFGEMEGKSGHLGRMLKRRSFGDWSVGSYPNRQAVTPTAPLGAIACDNQDSAVLRTPK